MPCDGAVNSCFTCVTHEPDAHSWHLRSNCAMRRKYDEGVKYEGILEYLEPKAVFSFLYGDDQVFKRNHEEQNDEIYAIVSDWTTDGRRTINLMYSPSLKLLERLSEHVDDPVSFHTFYCTGVDTL